MPSEGGSDSKFGLDVPCLGKRDYVRFRCLLESFTPDSLHASR
jgi:hypothetical protein